jgi:uncharacterized protein (DUF1800 family)
MRLLAVRALLATVILTARPVGRLTAQSLTPHDSALHALNRLAYGPRPGEVDSVARAGVLRWIDAQLDPRKIPDPAVADAERRFDILDQSPRDLAAAFETARQERIQRQRQRPDTGAMAADALPQPPERIRRLVGELQDLAVVRAVLSERQLQEVMVDFWTNHFNIFAGKGADRFLTADYIEHVIRPNAFGKFADLLIATAKSPAMLFYLDNWQSVAPGAEPPQLARAGMGGRRRFYYDPMMDARRDSLRRAALDRMPKGINENYGRELLELHTLGVDGGYTQQDVIGVARIFTGWSIERPNQGGGFVFNDWAHDRGAKTVLGVAFPAGHGEDEGVRLLKLLAMQHATMHHVSWQLCQRFVADEPPDGCVDDAVAAWQRSDGDIRAVLRAIFHGPDFWATQNVAAKTKTPLEFVVSAVRAVNAYPDSTFRLAQVVARLGEPLFQHVAPDGYPETEADWVNSGALLDRMNAAVGLAAGHLPGSEVDLDALIPPVGDHAALVDAISTRVLSGAMSDHTRKVILDQLADVTDSVQARNLAVGFALGGPEFQKQ